MARRLGSARQLSDVRPSRGSNGSQHTTQHVLDLLARSSALESSMTPPREVLLLALDTQKDRGGSRDLSSAGTPLQHIRGSVSHTPSERSED